ncbi:MAG: hypothetical protein RSA01_01325 [Clostridium sp.]|uniref:hypothetical protein n=1 Tax=Clostridium sp. TaxID=1506 RepID=UPI002FC8274F
MNIPFFLVPLLCIMLILPIVSIEGITPWALFIYYGYKIITYANREENSNKILIKSIKFLSLNILFVFLYNLAIYFATNFIIKNIL